MSAKATGGAAKGNLLHRWRVRLPDLKLTPNRVSFRSGRLVCPDERPEAGSGSEDLVVTDTGGGLDPQIIARLAALCEADPQRERCGLVLRRGGALSVVEIPNAADRCHAADPVRFPRTSRDSYLMDPKALLAAHRELDARGGEIAAVWHSHIQAGAHFSAKDRADALIDGTPAIPGADHLVLGMRAGRVAELRRYTFAEGDFVERPL